MQDHLSRSPSLPPSVPDQDSARLRAQTNRGNHLIRQILADYQGPVSVRMQHEPTASDQRIPTCSLVFNEPGPLRDLILHRDLVTLGEAYLAGAVDVDGDIQQLFSLAPYLQALDLSWQKRLALAMQALRLPAANQHTKSSEVRYQSDNQQNSTASIAHHYDVSNAFYKLWLDPEMVYSCAYFQDAGQSLATAQHNKLDYICRKLRLAPDQKLLDIGCGWGALAIWAARHYGVRSHGITLSQAQYDYATERVTREGLQDRVQIELRDYRDLLQQPIYDRVVSIGMFEHVGIRNLPTYFNTVKQVLKPQGLFLNHGITNDTGWRRTPVSRFVNRYVFPDGELTRISEVSNHMEQAGFELLDVESLRRHYALTLRHWLAALEAQQQAVIQSSSETTFRLWRLYMAAAAAFFDQGGLNVYQVLAGHVHNDLTLPWCRDDLYRQ